MVDIGGEIAVFGSPLNREKWRLGIQDPFVVGKDGVNVSVRWKVAIKDCSIATSGNYRQYVEIQGQKFSHIVDPRTAMPVDILPSVTVIAPTTCDADALATALSVMGPKAGLKLIESIPNTEAFMVGGTVQNPKYYRTSDFSKYELPTNK